VAICLTFVHFAGSASSSEKPYATVIRSLDFTMSIFEEDLDGCSTFEKP
jgi:hypothetical protein